MPSPSVAPIAVPAQSPQAATIAAPISAPVASPFEAPNSVPAAEPVAVPAEPPTSIAPVESPVLAPVSPPVASPVQIPLAAPITPPAPAPATADVPVQAPTWSPISSPMLVITFSLQGTEAPSASLVDSICQRVADSFSPPLVVGRDIRCSVAASRRRRSIAATYQVVAEVEAAPAETLAHAQSESFTSQITASVLSVATGYSVTAAVQVSNALAPETSVPAPPSNTVQQPVAQSPSVAPSGKVFGSPASAATSAQVAWTVLFGSLSVLAIMLY
jgi:hypothetical protein